MVLDEVDQLLKDRSHAELEQLLKAIPIMKDRNSFSIPAQAAEARKTKHNGIVFLSSATADAPLVQRFAEQHLAPGWEKFSPSAATSGNRAGLPRHVTHGMVVCPEGGRIEALRKIFFAKPVPMQTLVFANDAHRVNVICDQLAEANIISAPLCGNVTKVDRQDIMARIRDGRISVLVSTDLAARGIDLPEVSHVVNYDLPINAESYLHRAGRCGRAGRSGLMVSLASKDRQFIPVKLATQLQTPLHMLRHYGGQTWISGPINKR